MSLIDTLRALAITVRNEKKKEANSAVRIGDMFLSIIDYLFNLDIHNKGFFSTSSLLKREYPNPILGDYAYVGDTNTIWEVSNGLWVDSGKDIPEDIPEALRHFQIISSQEFIYLILDINDLILFGVRIDGSFYTPVGLPDDIYKLLSNYLTSDETEHLILQIQSSIHEVTEDNEDRLELTYDAENKIVSFREKDGTKVENRLRVEDNFTLGNRAKTSFIKDLKSSGLEDSTTSMNPNLQHLPMPTMVAEVSLTTSGIPITKTDNIVFSGVLKYGGVKRNIRGIWNAQGSSSMGHVMKNANIDLIDENGDADVLKFGNWVAQDSYHWKAFYIDASKARCNVSYWLAEAIYQTRPNGQKRPYERFIFDNTTITNGTGKVADDLSSEPLTHPDGFPFALYVNGEFYGIFVWNLKKHRDNYAMKKSNAKHIFLDGIIDNNTIFGGTVDWGAFEIRNPKDLKTVSGGKYDGDNPTEITGDTNIDAMTAETKGYIERLASAMPEIESIQTREVFEKYFDVNSLIDYFIFAQVVQHNDGFAKNWLWLTWDGEIWSIGVYDCDLTFGATIASGNYTAMGANLVGRTPGLPTARLYYLYGDEIRARYKELRNKGILTVEYISGLFDKWTSMIGSDLYKMNLEKWNETPSYRNSNINNTYWTLIHPQVAMNAVTIPPYDENKNYQEGEEVYYKHPFSTDTPTFKCISPCQGEPPLTSFYSSYPRELGYFESTARMKKWTKERLAIVDTLLNYSSN